MILILDVLERFLLWKNIAFEIKKEPRLLHALDAVRAPGNN
jgi:hypothetical protein